jgi:hypothetical protein
VFFPLILWLSLISDELISLVNLIDSLKWHSIWNMASNGCFGDFLVLVLLDLDGTLDVRGDALLLNWRLNETQRNCSPTQISR